MTMQTILVLQALLKDPAREMYGLELAKDTGVMPGTAYPLLLRLETHGWVTSRRRAARRYYRLTATRAALASAAFAAVRRPGQANSPRPGTP